MAKSKRLEQAGQTEKNEGIRTKNQPSGTQHTPIIYTKLNTEDQIKITVDHCRGLTVYELEKKYGIDHNTVCRYLQGNADRIPEIKQEMANRCLAVALRAQSYISDEKLQKSSASQLTTIARESVYTGLMLTGGKLPDNGSVNIAKLVIETANILQQTIKPSEKPVPQVPQNTKSIDISTDNPK